MAFIFNLVNIKLPDQFEIMFPEVVLIIILESCFKEKLLHLDIFKFIHKAFVYGMTFTHLAKGFDKYLVKIPVDKIVFILKISVESLACNPTGIGNFFYSNLLDRRGIHTFFHCIGQSVFYVIVHLITRCYINCS